MMTSCFASQNNEYKPEVGVSHIRATHEQVSSLNLQVSSKSQVPVIKIKQVKSLLRSNKSQEVCMNVFFISVDTVNRRGWLVNNMM